MTSVLPGYIHGINAIQYGYTTPIMPRPSCLEMTKKIINKEFIYITSYNNQTVL